jgi:hypothetical protein
MLFVSTGRDGRGHGRTRTICPPPSQASGIRWPGGAVGRLVLGFRALFSVPGGRRDARLGRPVVFRPGLPECPAGAPRSCAGPADVPRSPGASVKECPGLHPPAQALLASQQAAALSVSGGRTVADEESAAPAERRKERTAGHRAAAVLGRARFRQFTQHAEGFAPRLEKISNRVSNKGALSCPHYSP